MERDNNSVPFPTCPNLPNIGESSMIIEEGPRICPLCNSIVRLFYLNFKEKLLMCENTECEFPFGYEELQFVKLENDMDCDDDVSTTTKTGRSSPTNTTVSTGSTVAWAEIDRINRACDSEDNQAIIETNEKELKLKKKQEEKESEEQLLKNVEAMKKLGEALYKQHESVRPVINNEKWVKNLMTLQGMTGTPLLKQEEIEKFKKRELNVGSGELKIDINLNADSTSTIKIETANTNKNA